VAYPVIGHCPVCDERLEVTRLHCRHCDTSVEGHFSLGYLYELTQEQLKFAEIFIRCEGKINRVGEELGVSYPTVRNRLNDLIRAMGYEVEEPSGLSTGERREVLEQLSQGEITSSQALKMLKDK